MAESSFHAAVTGIGLVTPGGVGVGPSWEAILAGRPTAARDSALRGMPVDFSCRVPDFDPDALLGRRTAWRLDRYVQLALVAAREALADAGLDPSSWDGSRVGVVMGNALGGVTTFADQHQTMLAEGVHRMSALLIPMMGVNMVAGYLAMDCHARGPNLVTTTACASATTAIGTARDLLRSGRCDIVLAGGAEAGLSPAIVAGFTRMGALSSRVSDPASASRPFERDRDGFVVGEGAGVLVLERPAHARARGARIRAHVSGYGASADAHHPTAPDPAGVGAEAAVRAALADACLTAADVDHVSAHGTSTRAGDAVEAGLVRRVFPGSPAVTSVKGVTGHALGAAGAIEAACAVLSLENSVVPPTANLTNPDPCAEIDLVRDAARPLAMAAATSNSFGFGGQNAVLVLTAA